MENEQISYDDLEFLNRKYSDPTKKSDKWSIPDVRVFADKNDKFYYDICFPGCMPDSGLFGPFSSMEDLEESLFECFPYPD